MPSLVVLLILLGIAVAVRPYLASWAEYGLLRRFGQSYLLFFVGVAVVWGIFLFAGALLIGGTAGGMPIVPSPMELILPLLLPPLFPAVYLTYLLGKGNRMQGVQGSAWYGDGGSPSRHNGQDDSGGDADSYSGDSGGE